MKITLNPNEEIVNKIKEGLKIYLNDYLYFITLNNTTRFIIFAKSNHKLAENEKDILIIAFYNCF